MIAIKKKKFECVKNIQGRILDGWSKSITENYVPYYINHNHIITQWDHPEYIRIIDEALNINSVRYAAYRTAYKLRHLQKQLKFDSVTLYNISSAFHSAGLRSSENRDIISVKEIEKVLFHILRNAHKNSLIDYSVIVELTLNLLLNAYDENRSGNLQVMQCKVFLLVLCEGKLQDKYRYLFSQMANHSNCCTRKQLARVLHMFAMIAELFSEQINFGVTYITAAVDSCFKELTGDGGIQEERFFTWLLQEPQMLVWWTTLYRLYIAEVVCHDVKCCACKQKPCVGLRYQCLRCINYNLCQECFLHSRMSRGHKLWHPVQEYCCESTGKDWRRALMKMLQYRLKGRRHMRKPRYLSLARQPFEHQLCSLLQETDDLPVIRELPDFGNAGRELDAMSRTVCHSLDALNHLQGEPDGGQTSGEPLILPTNPSHLIFSIIQHLRDGHKRLRERLEKGTSSSLSPHISELETQIDKLDSILKKNPSILKYKKIPKNELPRMESTPIVGERGLSLSLSPIRSGSHNDTAILDNKENHQAEDNCDIVVCSVQHNKSALPFEANTDLGNQEVSVRPKEIVRFPSFAEVSFGDLTSTSSSIAIEGDGSISNNNINRECQEELRRWKALDTDTSPILHLKQEFDNALESLNGIFPLHNQVNKSPNKPCDVITSANEVADCMINYIETFPFDQEITSF